MVVAVQPKQLLVLVLPSNILGVICNKRLGKSLTVLEKVLWWVQVCCDREVEWRTPGSCHVSGCGQVERSRGHCRYWLKGSLYQGLLAVFTVNFWLWDVVITFEFSDYLRYGLVKKKHMDCFLAIIKLIASDD